MFCKEPVMLVQAVSPAPRQVLQLCACRGPCGRVSCHALSLYKALLSAKGADLVDWCGITREGRVYLQGWEGRGPAGLHSRAGSRSDSSLSLHRGCPCKSKQWGQAKAQPRGSNNQPGQAITHPMSGRCTDHIPLLHILSPSSPPWRSGTGISFTSPTSSCLQELSAPWTRLAQGGSSLIPAQCVSFKLNEVRGFE